MLQLIWILNLILFHYCLSEKPSGPLVHTNSGKIRGRYLTSYKGNTYEAYQGIPFALPPIGEKRFRAPVPVEPWLNELQATKLKDMCLQVTLGKLNMSVIGSEDCLYLNVYVPTNKKANVTHLPVLFYIYGGGFEVGGTTVEQEIYIIDYDVIFVSINHRMGCLGFLSTDDEFVTGNMGLKDQSLALRWVYDNIETFGGDQKKITLLGVSSGGISIQYHYLSPWSRGLFHAGISLSNNAFGPGAIAQKQRRKAIGLGRLVNCTDNDIRQMVKCLRRVSAEVLIAVQNKLEERLTFPPVYAPVIEKSSTEPFVDDYPSEILKKGKAYDVPWVTGIVSEEGLALTAGYMRNDTLKHLDENWDSVSPFILNYLFKVPEEQYVSIARKIRKHYLGEKPINRVNFHALTDIITDRYFSYGGVNGAKAQAAANKSPVFFYYYTYRAVDSLSNEQSNSTENLGVAHGDDISLVIKNPTINPTKSPNDMAMQRCLIEIWTSVAYNGVPKIDVEWQRVTPNNSTGLDFLRLVGPDNLVSESNNDFGQINFWNEIGLDKN